MGFPDENPPPRPRYPLEVSLVENEYPELDDSLMERAMAQMDEGYLAQDYYSQDKVMLPLEGGQEETFTYDNYS